ncbi:MAG: hypothetical protein ABJP82_21025, partial [Hyphomicrobiales bacterium]
MDFDRHTGLSSKDQCSNTIKGLPMTSAWTYKKLACAFVASLLLIAFSGLSTSAQETATSLPP